MMKNKFLFYTQQSVVILFSFLQSVNIFLNKKGISGDKTQDKDQYTSYFMSTLQLSLRISHKIATEENNYLYSEDGVLG